MGGLILARPKLWKIADTTDFDKCGISADVFTFSDKVRALARDREDWKDGRLLPQTLFLRYGDLDVELDRIVLDSGQESQSKSYARIRRRIW